MQLTLERKAQQDETTVIAGGAGMFAPLVNEDYWEYRVLLNENGQAIVGFPKFGIIGVGFAQEDDWNTNLPSSVDARRILLHICHNKGDDKIEDAAVLAAIRLVQDAVIEDVGGEVRSPADDDPQTDDEAFERCAVKRAEYAAEED